MERELDLGLKALAKMKEIRREDEAERIRLGLTVEPNDEQSSVTGRPTGRTIIHRNGETFIYVTMEQPNTCPACGHEIGQNWRFCSVCGHQLA
jgi:hypothetical protein